MSSTRGGGDALCRYYTPDAVAQACVQALSELYDLRGRVVLEPCVGAGAWARAARAAGVAEVRGCEIDRDAAGLSDCDRYLVGDYLTFPGPSPKGTAAVGYARHFTGIDIVLGNPPYSGPPVAGTKKGRHVGAAWIRRSLEIAPVVAMLVRAGQVTPLSRQHEPFPTHALILSPRPSFTGGSTDSCEYIFAIWVRGYAPGARGTFGRVLWRTS